MMQEIWFEEAFLYEFKNANKCKSKCKLTFQVRHILLRGGASKFLPKFSYFIYIVHLQGVHNYQDLDYHHSHQPGFSKKYKWLTKNISGSFYYALVVLTLIGYGHSTPNTVFGKMFTMGYASLGIPAAMIMFQSMGERMNKVFSVIIRKVKTFWGCSRTEVSICTTTWYLHILGWLALFLRFCNMISMLVILSKYFKTWEFQIFGQEFLDHFYILILL